MYDAMARIAEPVARPSRPSATLTALDVLTTMTLIQTTNSTMPMAPSVAKSSASMSRTPEIMVDAAVSPSASGYEIARIAKPEATMTWPATFAQPVRPRLR